MCAYACACTYTYTYGPITHDPTPHHRAATVNFTLSGGVGRLNVTLGLAYGPFASKAGRRDATSYYSDQVVVVVAVDVGVAQQVPGRLSFCPTACKPVAEVLSC